MTNLSAAESHLDKDEDEAVYRVLDMEQVLIRGLNLFNQVLVNSHQLSPSQTADLIIEEFQKLVMKAKNDKISHSSSDLKSIVDIIAKPAPLNLNLKNASDVVKSIPSSSKSPPAVAKNQPSITLPMGPETGSMSIVKDNTVDNVLKDVAEKADTLESGLKQEKFLHGQQEEGSTIETVVKVGGDKSDYKSGRPKTSSSSSSEANSKPVVLIDSANNQYVLSKPGDATANVEDTALMQDLLVLLLVCCVSGIVMYCLGLPVFFGYILAGTILSKNRLIENAVQVETISRGLGVIFIMFYLGLEFNLTKIGRIWSVSFFGSLLLLSLTLFISCSVFPRFVHASIPESIVIGESVFLSSTAVVSHFLKPGESETNYGRSIMGVLVAQDILLGFLLAIMPGLEQSGGLYDVAYTAARLIFLSILFTIASYILRIPILLCLSWLNKKSKTTKHAGPSAEVFLLTSISVLLVYLGLGRLFEQSVELSCFVAGVMVASQKTISESVLLKLEAFKQIFSALFFASIGLHIYPSFLYNEGGLLLFLTAVVMLFKAVTTAIIMNVAFRVPVKTAGLIGIGLAQISEFTFVLASKAKGRGILSREFFFILIGVTSISMFLSPFLWRISSYLMGALRLGNTTLPTYMNVDGTDDAGSGGERDDIGEGRSWELIAIQVPYPTNPCRP